jgi:hypothetical protein
MKLRLLIIGIVACWLCGSGFAEVNFVQITDPHIFDGKGDVDGNKEALKWCIDQINARVDAKADYKFIVVTGDLGLEGLPRGAGEERDQKGLVEAAIELAGIIKNSKVNQWLFLPGNNDLDQERPGTIGIFHNFINALQQKLSGMITIVDFCPRENKLEFGTHEEGTCRFIGFNNASFKSNDSAADAANKKDFEDKQVENVKEVLARLAAPGDFKHAYIFYHIPEIDDPFYAALDPNKPDENKKLKDREEKRGEIGKNSPYSAWTVTPAVRAMWNEVLKNDKVKGLFAGHFHFPERETYQGFRWLRDPTYLSGSLSKLYVCPPVASKRQETEALQARGFREVSIDCESGKIKSSIFWYEKKRGAQPQLVEKELALSVDPVTNTASGLIHLSNPTEREISISLSADDFKSLITGYGLNSKVVFAAPAQATGVQVYEATIAAGKTAAVKVDVSNFGEAGEATARVHNYGECIGLLRATKWRPPFSVKVVSPTPDKPELTFTKGKSGQLTLKNDDQMTYPVAVSIELNGVWSKPSFVRLTPGGAAPIDLKPRKEWFPEAARVNECVRDGNIRLSLQLPNGRDKPALAERVVPFKAHLNWFGEFWQTFWSYLFVVVWVTVGGVGSMILSNWVPNRLSRADIEEQLNALAGRTRDLSSRIDSGLRVLLRVERTRVHQLLKSWWAFSANFPDVVKQCTDKIAVLSKQIDLATQLDRARLGLEHAMKASPIAAKVRLVDDELQRAADLLRRSEPRTEDLDAAKVAIMGATEQISKMEQTEPEPDATFVAALSKRIDSLNAYLQLPESDGLKEIKTLLPRLFANLPAASTDLPPSQYSSVDFATSRLELVREYLAYYDSAAAAEERFPKQKECIEHLNTDTPLGLHCARLLLKQIKERIFVENIVGAIKDGSAEIVVEPAPMQDQLVKFTVQFKDDRLNAASAREEIRCQWDFGDKYPPETGWEAYHYFLIPRASKLDRWRALCHGTWLPKTAASKKYNVSATFGGTIAGASPPPPIMKEIEVLKMPAQASADRNRAEVVRLGIALAIALIGLLAGAREKLATLDVVPAAIAVILLGFGADTIKNLISPKQTQR